MPDTTGLEVYKSIAAITKAIGREGIAKDRKNQQQGYSFRGIDEVFNALNPLLAAHDLCVLPRMIERWASERASKNGGVLFSVTVKADYDFVSARDGSRHTVSMYGEGVDSADKATNKAMSAAYKYACFEAFCIPTEGLMEEADSVTPEVAPPAPKSASKVPPQPWSAQFKEFFLEAGPNEYGRLLGIEGYESARDIPNQATAKKALDNMRRAYSANQEAK